MGFQGAVTTCFSKYVTFEGRAARPEYWYWVLFVIVVAIAIGILQAILPSSISAVLAIVLMLFELAVILPGLAVSVRRLHDIDKSGWFILLGLIPIIGGLILLYFMVQRGTEGQNRFGGAEA